MTYASRAVVNIWVSSVVHHLSPYYPPWPPISGGVVSTVGVAMSGHRLTSTGG